MSDLKNWTAAELAHALEAMANFPHNTSGLSMLDEATIAFGEKSAEIRQASRSFEEARLAHKRSYASATDSYSDEAWQNAMQAGRRLAMLLWVLGDVRIARCTRPAGWGTCNLPLDEDGQCRSTLGHLDSDEEQQ